MTPEELANSIKVYEIFRDRIKHQDLLIAHRVGYFLVMQAALVTFVIAPSKQIAPAWVSHWLIPISGWSIAIGLLLSIYFAFCSIELCVERYSSGKLGETSTGIHQLAVAPREFGNLSISGLPPLRSQTLIHICGHSTPWLVVFSGLLLWPALSINAEFSAIGMGNVNGFWFTAEIASLGAFIRLFGKHWTRCNRNDSKGINKLNELSIASGQLSQG